MKSLVLLLFIPILLCNCSRPSEVEPPQEQLDPKEMVAEAEAKHTYTGAFVAAAHPTEGSVQVNAQQSRIDLIGFKTDAGPLLELYLSTDLKATEFVSLGELKGLEGDFSYEIPSNVNLDTHKYLMVWCVEFYVDFGHAILEPN